MVNPAVLTVLPVPTFLSEKDPVALPEFKITLSVPITPERAADPVFRVAIILPLYILLFAVTPVTVNTFLFMVRLTAVRVVLVHPVVVFLASA